MIKYIIPLLLFFSLTASAQYTPNAGAYQYKGLKQINSLQPPSTAGMPVTAINAPDSNYTALYYNKTDTTWYQFNPVTKVWSPLSGIATGLIDSVTWQKALDNGSVLDKDNTIDGTTHFLYFTNMNWTQFVSENPDTHPGLTGVIGVNPNGGFLSAYKSGYSSAVGANTDSVLLTVDSIDEGNGYETYMSMTKDYIRFDKKTLNGEPVYHPNPHIIYPSDTILEAPEYIFVSDNDTIKKYPFSANVGNLSTLYSGFGINIFDSSYNPGIADAVVAVDTTALADWVVNIVQGDTTIINNQDSIIAEFYVDTLANAPPASPVEGYKVLIGTNPTGAFAGHANNIAERVGSDWVFTEPQPNDVAIVDNPITYEVYQWNGTAWKRTAVLAKWGGQKGLGNNAGLGTNDKKRWFLEAWNKQVLKIDTTRKISYMLYDNADVAADDSILLTIRPGGIIDTTHAHQLQVEDETGGTSRIEGNTIYINPIGGGGGAGDVTKDGIWKDSIMQNGDLAFRIEQMFNVYDYGAVADGVTDATAGIQAAINACVAAGGGVVYFPYSPNYYKISGSLITSLDGVNPNCQLYIPLVSAQQRKVTITLRGAAPTAFSSETLAGTARTPQGVVLFSTIQGTGTTPAILGSPWYNAGFTGNRTYIEVNIENLEFRTQTKGVTNNDTLGTMSAINASKFLTFGGNEIHASVSSSLDSNLQPTNETYGIILPAVNNMAKLEMGMIMVEGYKYGIQMTEHANIAHLSAVACVNGIKVADGYHAATITKLTAEANINNITLDGTLPVTILDYETEHVPASEGRWFTFVSDIKQVSGTSKVNIFNANVVESFAGVVDNFVTSGSPVYYIYNGIGRNVYPLSVGAFKQPLVPLIPANAESLLSMQNDVGFAHFELTDNSYYLPARRRSLQISTDATQTGGLGIGTNSNTALEFRTDNTARLTISGSGTSNYTGNITTNSATVPSYASLGSLVVSTPTGSSSSGSTVHVAYGSNSQTFGIFSIGAAGSSSATWALGVYKGAADATAYTIYETNFTNPRFSVFTGGNVGIGNPTNDATNKLQVNGNVKATQFRVSAMNTAPSSASDTGTAGEIRITATYIYVCTATNTWVRAALATW